MWRRRIRTTPVRALRRLARDESHAGARCGGLVPCRRRRRCWRCWRRIADVWVRRNVASNPSTPRAALEVLLRDRLAPVRAAAAENKNTPAEKVAAPDPRSSHQGAL